MPAGIGKEFMKQTRRSANPTPPQQQGVAQPPLELAIPTGMRLITLPTPPSLEIPGVDLRTMIEQRRSLRQYAPQALTPEELSYLLWLTQGIQQVTDRPATIRTVPSAGSRHAFETYLLINRVEGLNLGIYRYVASKHAIGAINQAITAVDDITRACLNQQQVKTSAVTFIWVAVLDRMYWRYTERGYRYLHLDAGHICQNLYLAGEAIGCGVCGIAAFDDDLLNTTLGLDGEKLFCVYAASLGKKA